MRSGDLADGVTDEDVRAYAVHLQQVEERQLECEHGGLGVAGGVQQRSLRRARIGEHDGPQRLGQEGVQYGTHGVEPVAELREPVVQLPPHAGPLGALAGEEESGRSRGGLGGSRRRGSVLGAEPGQRVQEFVAVVTESHEPVGEGGS